MKSHGQSTTVSSTKPKCPLCGDTGWIFGRREDGYTFSDECECQKAKRALVLIRRSGLGDAIEQQTFDSFRVENETQAQIKRTARAYADELLSLPSEAQRKPWMYVGGNPGAGKSHICTAVCGELLRANREVIYMQWLTESRQLKAYVNEPDFDRMVDKYVDCSVLYIDDLFKQTYKAGQNPALTDADIKMAFIILNNRYLGNKPTIISSEWELGSLLDADEGVFSRVYERCKRYTVHIPRDMQNNFRLRKNADAKKV